MEFFTVVGIILILYYLSHLIAVCFVDCDLTLALCQYFGKSLGKYLPIHHLNISHKKLVFNSRLTQAALLIKITKISSVSDRPLPVGRYTYALESLHVSANHSESSQVLVLLAWPL